MQRQPQRHYIIDDYFAVELNSAIKHEYCNGEIFTMAGASVAHNHITANVLGTVRGLQRPPHPDGSKAGLSHLSGCGSRWRRR